MNEDDDYSIEREFRREKHRRGDNKHGRGDNWAATKQARAIWRAYCELLTKIIAEDRLKRGRRDKTVWTALKDISREDIADRLLLAGVTACWGDNVGVDDDGVKNYLRQRVWLGEQLTVRNAPKQIVTRKGKRKVRRKYVKSEGEIALKVGDWGCNLLVSLAVFKFDTNKLLTLPPTDKVRLLVAEALVRGIATQPYLTPLLSLPEPWTGFRDGVLEKGRWANPPLIRNCHPSIRNAARKRIGTGQMQLDAINSLQSVPFVINNPVLQFMLSREERRLPELPPPLPPNASNGKRWWHERKVAEIKSQLTSWDLTVASVDFLVRHKRFYAPLSIDFRGRLYPLPFFNFTREDRVRALFWFADPLPIGVEGTRWLKAHVAGRANGNTWSTEKRPSRLNFDERIAWTENNLDTLCFIGEAVLRGDDPATLERFLPKKPYQFIAACVELKRALSVGPSFETGLPLTFDGSCSGLQHYCGMTLAEDEARRVNLLASDRAEDFYSDMAAEVYPRCAALMSGPDDRDLAKTPVMSWLYGSKPGGFSDGEPYGMTRAVVEELEEREYWFEGAEHFAETIDDAIAKLAPRATEARNILQQLAEICAKQNKPVRWETLLGLRVINIRQSPKTKRIKTWPDDRRREVKLAVGYHDRILKRKSENGIAANFVHSLDAAHMQRVALAAAAWGIPMVGVHDCFGCLAPHAERFNKIIRDEFVELHQRDFLAEVIQSVRDDLPAGVELPSRPERGTFDLEQVKQSFFAFS